MERSCKLDPIQIPSFRAFGILVLRFVRQAHLVSSTSIPVSFTRSLADRDRNNSTLGRRNMRLHYRLGRSAGRMRTPRAPLDRAVLEAATRQCWPVPTPRINLVGSRSAAAGSPETLTPAQLRLQTRAPTTVVSSQQQAHESNVDRARQNAPHVIFIITRPSPLSRLPLITPSPYQVERHSLPPSRTGKSHPPLPPKPRIQPN
jgi:hypothetical protein